MIKLSIEIGDLPAISYALNKGIEGMEAALVHANELDVSQRQKDNLNSCLHSLHRIKLQLEQGEIE